MLNGLKEFVKSHEGEIKAAGATITATAGAAWMSVKPVFADAASDAMNSSMDSLGALLDGFGNLIPHIITFVVACIPLMVIGAVIGAVVLIIKKVPEYLKI